MKAFVLTLALLGQWGAQTEVLVLTTATELARTNGRDSVEVFNNGPNTIWCAFSSAGAVATKARPIATNGSWVVDAKYRVRIWCVASTANQVTGAATIVSEIKE